MEEVQAVEEKANDIEKIYALLSYIFFFSILVYINKKDSDFVLHHAKQGLLVFVLSLANFVLVAVPVLGWILVPVLNIAIFVLFIIGVNNALAGKKANLPIIGQFSNIIK